MDIQNLKEYILENNKIPIILENLGCHHISHKEGYYTCGNHDGDNKNAITVKENTNLTCINYTRDISKNKNTGTDLFSLIEYVKDCSFFDALKFACDCIGIDYYHDFDEDIPESLKLTKLILELQQSNDIELKEKPLKPISENILRYYKSYVNDMFKNDGISYETQIEFEIGYDPESNRITIPIRDEIGNLVGIKGRLFQHEILEDELKYLYLEPCGRSKILYGLHKSYPYIKQSRKCFIGEAEKSCLQLWDMGYKNAIGLGGKRITSIQIEKLTRLCVDLILLLDKDVSEDEIKSISEKFIDGVNLYAVIDNKGILNEKESPTDSPEKFKQLMETCCYKIK